MVHQFAGLEGSFRAREERRRRAPQRTVCLLVACLTSQQHASVSQGWTCSDSCTRCHTEIEVFFLLLVGCLTSQQQASVSQGRTCSDSCTRCHTEIEFVCLLVGCLTSQQQASVSQGRICSDNLTCCHTEIEVADPTFYLTQSQYTDTGPTSPSADPI